MSVDNWEQKTEELMKLKKKELVGYIYLTLLASEQRAFSIIHPTEKSKKKFLYVIDKDSSRWQSLKLLPKHIRAILKEIL